MKILCKCGYHIIDSDYNRKYLWTTLVEHDQWYETIDAEIEKIRSPQDYERASMAIRYAEKHNPVWVCPSCQRLVTFINQQPVFLQREAD